MKNSLKILSRIGIFYFLVLTLVTGFGLKDQKTTTFKTMLISSSEPSAVPSVITLTSIPQTSSENTAPIQTAEPVTSALEATSTPQDLISQLPNHNTSSDCWMVISGHLYDLTSYFGQHPGGDALLAKYCGADATNAFATKDKSSGSAHSGFAQNLLQQFLIQ